MKRKLIYYILPLLLLASGCEKAEMTNLFDKSPEERAQQVVDDTKAKLVSSTHGWLAEYNYDDEQVHTTLLFRFKDNNRVEIESVYEDYRNNESNFNLRYAQELDLTFDTYSVMSFLRDQTQKADFRWQLVNETADQFKFVSRATVVEGVSHLTLKKADSSVLAYMARQRAIHTIRTILEHDNTKSFFRNLVLNGSDQKYEFSFDSYTDEITFKGFVNGAEVTHTSKIEVAADGTITLIDPLVVNGKSLDKFEYNESTGGIDIVNGQPFTGGVLYDSSPAYVATGAVDKMVMLDFSSVRWLSESLHPYFETILEDVPSISGIQLYFKRGYLILYANPAPTGSVNNHDGFESVKFLKQHENSIIMDNSSATIFRDQDWFTELYANNTGAQAFFNDFLFSSDGLYVIEAEEDNSYYLISKTDPTLYVLISGE